MQQRCFVLMDFFDASRNNSTSPASSHDCDQNITWADGVTSKVFILLMRYIPGLTLPEFIRHCIVDTENSNSFVNKFTMQQLASKRSSADGSFFWKSDLLHRSHRPFSCFGIAKHIEEGGLEQGVELGEGLAALGPQGVRRVQDGRNPLLLG